MSEMLYSPLPRVGCCRLRAGLYKYMYTHPQTCLRYQLKIKLELSQKKYSLLEKNHDYFRILEA